MSHSSLEESISSYLEKAGLTWKQFQDSLMGIKEPKEGDSHLVEDPDLIGAFTSISFTREEFAISKMGELPGFVSGGSVGYTTIGEMPPFPVPYRPELDPYRPPGLGSLTPSKFSPLTTGRMKATKPNISGPPNIIKIEAIKPEKKSLLHRIKELLNKKK